MVGSGKRTTSCNCSAAFRPSWLFLSVSGRRDAWLERETFLPGFEMSNWTRILWQFGPVWVITGKPQTAAEKRQFKLTPFTSSPPSTSLSLEADLTPAAASGGGGGGTLLFISVAGGSSSRAERTEMEQLWWTFLKLSSPLRSSASQHVQPTGRFLLVFLLWLSEKACSLCTSTERPHKHNY